MKKLGIVLFVCLLIITGLMILSNGDWHLKRNKLNKLPKGILALKKGTIYTDQDGLNWELQAHSKNIFHQPDITPVPAPPIPVPYPDVEPALKYDPDFPNLKFLSLDGKGGSYECILQPDGLFLIIGKKQGTYNYSNPSGVWGYTKHAFLDVLPHFFNSNYDDSLNQLPE
jgi:hypothetical protein